ncbi:tyrosine-type recombinase/integrase [Enterococcus caccae]|uniref:tyrosine-type recombinase/integrase n=1 Tax=Enterococcus caccae TaxID=317735 RepID=UPI001160431D
MERWQLKQREFLFSDEIKATSIIFSDIRGSHRYRNTHGSMLFESGTSMKEAQEQLGHSSIEMTMDVYTHLTKKKRLIS